MNSILKQIVADKIVEVQERKRINSLLTLENMPNFQKDRISLRKYLLDPSKYGIIAEFKRRSPSKGVINAAADVVATATGYQDGGASAMSVLTESKYFDGSDSDLVEAKQHLSIPVLRKDFVVDIFQIAEAKALGADAILLIAEVLDKSQLCDYLSYTHEIGLEALIEVHADADLEKLPADAQIVGVNGRNLNTFTVSLEHTASMLKQLPAHTLKVAESGITNLEDYMTLKNVGFNAFLIGELFMRSNTPGKACMDLTNAIKALNV